ncbi:MAG: DUF4384 domain-containing protein [Oscillatoria princeps RMCB-10]|jgi:hypothetical protein|nr:DUF4384 domain-containing protein [Oscillatoria princeps RMCB-10]
MPLPRYKDVEQEFLNAMADEWGFKDRCKLAFVKRFHTANDNLENQPLAEDLEKQLKEDSKDVGQTLRDYLRRIYRKLEAEGCPSQGVTKDKLDIARPWLRETIYPKWLKQYLWEQLQRKGRPTNQMGPVLVEVPTLGMLPANSYRHKVPKDSDIVFKVNLDSPGHLMLLERGPGGAMYCLCPSQYAPKSRFQQPGEAVLPQDGAPAPSFAPDVVGREQIVAIITQEEPALQWLEQSRREALELDKGHLQELLEYLEGTPKSQVLYMQYEVTAS